MIHSILILLSSCQCLCEIGNILSFISVVQFIPIDDREYFTEGGGANFRRINEWTQLRGHIWKRMNRRSKCYFINLLFLFFFLFHTIIIIINLRRCDSGCFPISLLYVVYNSIKKFYRVFSS